MSLSFVEKICQQCNKEFSLQKQATHWKQIKFCSLDCRYASQRGKKLPKETREKMSQVRSARVPTGENSPYWKGGLSNCIDCNIKVASYSAKRCSHCFIKKNRGKNHYSYKADRTTLKKGRIQAYDYAYRVWMKAVKNRDGWKCKIGNEDCNGRLEAHHILRWSKFPELRYEVNNGITLCHAHHPRKINDEIKLIPTFKELITV